MLPQQQTRILGPSTNCDFGQRAQNLRPFHSSFGGSHGPHSWKVSAHFATLNNSSITSDTVTALPRCCRLSCEHPSRRASRLPACHPTSRCGGRSKRARLRIPCHCPCPTFPCAAAKPSPGLSG